MISGCWDYSAQFISKWQSSEQSENSKAAATFTDRLMWDTHTYNPPVLQCIQEGAKTPDEHSNLFCTLQCIEQRRERHFLWKVHLGSEGGWSPAPRAIINSTRSSLAALASEAAASCKWCAGFSPSSTSYWGERARYFCMHSCTAQDWPAQSDPLTSSLL